MKDKNLSYKTITIWYSKIYLITISAAISAKICDGNQKICEEQKQCFKTILALVLSATISL